MKTLPKAGTSLKIGAFAASLLIMYFREPTFLLEPRLWAEEGSRYFSYAYGYPWHQSLRHVQIGYLALWPNFASTVAANLVPLSHVPLVTTLFAFIVQLIPIAIILWGQSDLWHSATTRIVGVLVVLFTPLSGEIWLNTANSQFYFSLIAFLILNENTDISPTRKWCYRILLVFSGLTGTVACLLSPLFILRSWLEKERERVVQASILLVCSIMQILVLSMSHRTDPTLSTRLRGTDLPTLASIIWTNSIALTLFGLENARAFAQVISAIQGLTGPKFEFLGLLLLFSGTLFFLCLSSELSPQRRLALLGSYFLIIIPSILGSLGDDKFGLVFPEAGQRYFYVPNVILMFAMLSNVHFNGKAFKRIRCGLFAVLLAASLTLGAMAYRRTSIVGDDWPKWREEILLWEENSEHLIEIWPPGWRIHLGETER